MGRKILCVLVVLLLCALVVTATDTVRLNLRLEDGGAPLTGVSFELHQVGEVDEKGAWVLTGDYAGFPVDLSGDDRDSNGNAEALYALVKKAGIAGNWSLVTDETGTAVAENLEPGVYLLGGQSFLREGYVYHTQARLIALPQKDAQTGEDLENPALQVKFSKQPDQPTSLKVLKIWDDGAGANRQEQITVHLLKDGQIAETVVLSEENQWRYQWENLDANALWQIAEEVPEGYTVKLEKEAGVFLLTNSMSEPQLPIEPGPGNIPQTGMLLWPVILLAGLGLVCITAGICLRKEKSYGA